MHQPLKNSHENLKIFISLTAHQEKYTAYNQQREMGFGLDHYQSYTQVCKKKKRKEHDESQNLVVNNQTAILPYRLVSTSIQWHTGVQPILTRIDSYRLVSNGTRTYNPSRLVSTRIDSYPMAHGRTTHDLDSYPIVSNGTRTDNPSRLVSTRGTYQTITPNTQ